MNQALRWKAFVQWWDYTFPAGTNLDNYSSYQIVNMIEDKVFELKQAKNKKCIDK